jgi:hypothetical protein
MLCVLFDEVLHISPSDTLWTITGRSKSVIEIVKLAVILPLGSVVLVFGCGSAAKIECIVFWENKPSMIHGMVLVCYLTFGSEFQTVLDNGSHGSHARPWTDTDDWGFRIVREGNKSSRYPNKDSITFRQDQRAQDTGKHKTYPGPG